ncbi:MAG: hypothetical protein AB7G12_09575 [Thermoanaerobaculia bacterium]
MVLLFPSSVLAEDPRSRLEKLEVGEVLRDEATGLTAEFLQKNVGAGKVDGWQRAESKACGFTVELFGPFNELKQQTTATDGARITIVVVGNRTLEGAKFSATCWRRSDNTFKAGFVREVFARLSEANEVLERRSVKRDGFEAERLSVKSAASFATVEMFEMDHTFFQLQVEYPIREAAYMPAMVERFLASFRR